MTYLKAMNEIANKIIGEMKGLPHSTLLGEFARRLVAKLQELGNDH